MVDIRAHSRNGSVGTERPDYAPKGNAAQFAGRQTESATAPSLVATPIGSSLQSRVRLTAKLLTNHPSDGARRPDEYGKPPLLAPGLPCRKCQLYNALRSEPSPLVTEAMPREDRTLQSSGEPGDLPCARNVLTAGVCCAGARHGCPGIPCPRPSRLPDHLRKGSPWRRKQLMSSSESSN